MAFIWWSFRPLKFLQSCPQLHDTPLVLAEVLVCLLCFVPVLISDLVMQLLILSPPLRAILGAYLRSLLSDLFETLQAVRSKHLVWISYMLLNICWDSAPIFASCSGGPPNFPLIWSHHPKFCLQTLGQVRAPRLLNVEVYFLMWKYTGLHMHSLKKS